MKLAFAFLFFFVGIPAFAQGRINARVQNFQANPSVEGRRYFIKGDNAEQLGNGITLLVGPHVETFKVDGSPDMIIDAREALFDQSGTRDVWSDKDLSAKSANGVMSVTGMGFRWGAAHAQLSISNKVEAVLGREGIAATAASTNTIRITSDQMTYTAELLIFSGNVHVVDPQGEVRCRTLRVRFDGKEAQEIEAIGGVVLSQSGTIANGERALYSRSTGLLRLSGKTSWRMEDRKGESEILVLDRTNKTIRAEMNVRMTLPSSSLVNTNSGASDATNYVTISADSFDYAPTNRVTGGPIAIYNGNVRAVDPQAKVDCELLTIFFNQTNRIVRAVADRSVLIARPQTSVRGEKAIFENEEITVSGNPVWRHEEKSGSSEVLAFNPRTGEIRASQVRMEIPFTSTGTQSLFGGSQLTNKLAVTNILLVTASYFTNKDRVATFAENVRARGPRGQIDANWISVEFNATNRPTRIKADGDVILTEAKAQAMGQRADFDVNKGIVRLIGVPKVLAGTNSIIAREIIFDRNSGKVKYLPPFFGELTQTNQPAN